MLTYIVHVDRVLALGAEVTSCPRHVPPPVVYFRDRWLENFRIIDLAVVFTLRRRSQSMSDVDVIGAPFIEQKCISLTQKKSLSNFYASSGDIG